MKTYLLDSYNRYRRYSETLDVKTQLCNRTWVVFNDGDERELYKFKEDGTIRIILSGRVSSGNWEFDPNDKSMIISASDQSIMVHPGMHEGILMGLQVDGTEECAFLIEENNAHNFAPKTRTELIQYFEEQERKRIEEQQRILALEAEQLRRMEEERRTAAKEADAKRIQQARIELIIKDFAIFLNNNHYSTSKSASFFVYTLKYLLLFLTYVIGVVLPFITHSVVYWIYKLNSPYLYRQVYVPDSVTCFSMIISAIVSIIFILFFHNLIVDKFEIIGKNAKLGNKYWQLRSEFFSSTYIPEQYKTCDLYSRIEKEALNH